MKWKELQVSCGFGGGEETKRFGPRQEIGSSLYQVDTVATISNKNQDVGSPWFFSAGCKDKVAVVLENHVLLFDDSCSRQICSFDAGACIDAISWDEDGTFLVFVDRSGWFSLAHTETEQVLFSKNLASAHNIAEERRCFASVILSKVLDDTYDLIVITSTGTGFRFTGVDLVNLNKAVQEHNIDETNKIQEDIQLHMFNLEECNSIASVTLSTNAVSLLVVGSGDFALTEWSLEEYDVSLIDVCTHVIPDAGFKKCLESADGLYLVILDTMNQIMLFSRQSFCLLDSWCESNIDDFILFLTSSVETDSSNKSQAKEDLKIVLLSTLENGKRDLIVLGLPNFEHVYTLKVSSCATLASLPIQHEIIMFLVGDKDNEKKDIDVDSINVKCLMEAIPQNRFSRLLHSKKFQEAEMFAMAFNLDMQLVYHVKSNYILDQLAPWGGSFSSTSNEKFLDLMVQLKSCLDKIDDMERVVNYCLRAQLPSLEATYDLLNYAREKVRVYFQTRKFTKSSNLFQELLGGINRLVTFETAFGAAHFSGMTWSHFLSSSLIEEVIKCFNSRSINSAFVLWRRHQSEFESIFKLKELNAILNSIPDSTPSSKLIPWLREDFVPFVLTVLPEGQCILADWLEKTARRLEFSVKEKENWPDNALEMAEVMFTTFTTVSQSTQERGVATSVQFATKIAKLSIPYIDNTDDGDATEQASAMKKLGNLVKNLREIKSLHHQYNCKISLDQFSKEDSTRILFHLLDRIAAAELIPQTMTKYVKPYVLKNNLKVDDLLYEYIAMVVDSRNQMASIWEPKVISIINEIHKKEQRCDATLKLMLKAKTPWSMEVESLIVKEMNANPDNTSLQRQFQFAKLRKMMQGYGIRDANLADTSKINAVIRYMFSTDNPNSIEDALQISKHFLICKSYVYSEQIQYWIENNKIEEACELLPQISKTDLLSLTSCIVSWVLCAIEWEPLDDDDKAEYVKITHAVVLLLDIAIKLDDTVKLEVTFIIDILRNISCLQMEFGLFLSYESYVDMSHKKDAIQCFLKDPMQYVPKFSCDRKASKNPSYDSRLRRFSQLLGFDNTSFYELLLDLYEQEQNLEKIYEITCELLQVDEEGKFTINSDRVKLLYKAVCYLLFGDLSTVHISWVKMANDIYQCACKALTSCPEDNLCDYLMISKLTRFMSVIASQCDSIDYQDDTKSVSGSFNWIEDYYKDDSLVLSSVDVYPLIRRILLLLFPDCSGSLLKYESNCLSGKGPFVNKRTIDDTSQCYVAIYEFTKASEALVNMLCENNHQELALQILMFGISVCSQRMGTLQLGINVLPDDDPVLLETNFLTEAELKLSKLILGKGESFVTEISRGLVNAIISHRVIDHDLALCYLDVFSASEGQQILVNLQNKMKTKFSRMQSIAKVGFDFAALHGDPTFKETCHIRKECAYWGRKLQILRVGQSWDIFKAYSDELEKTKILEMLVGLKSIDLKSIISYCEFFNFDQEEAIFMYIKCSMLPSEQVGSITDTSYQERIDQCDLSQINNLKTLESLFYSMTKKISSYDYERLAYIFKKIAEMTDNEETRSCAEENVQLIDMLSMYKCTANDMSSITDASTSMIDDIDDEQMFDGKISTVSPEVAMTRLPFHLLAKKEKGIAWTVLNPELTSEKNVVLLKPIVRRLKFSTDQMFAKAVQLIATKELAKGSAASFKFSLVENILNMIQDDTMMMATAKWVVLNLPRGDEKAKVLKAIITRASNLLSKSSDEAVLQNAKIMYQKFNEWYKKASYEAALLDFGITDKKYFRLCSGAAKLIIQLYEDYGDKMTLETGRFTGAPDVHALAKRIEAISETVDLERIHLYLMNKWLPWIRPSSSSEDDEDGDMSLISRNEVNIKKDNENNLKRVIYLLASSYNCNTIRTLLNAVYQENDGFGMTNMCRVRALQVLFTLVDARTIEVESNLAMEDILEKLVSCMYLSELESMHVSHTEESFCKANKENLVRGLWRNHSHKPEGIRLIADICLDYQIFDPQLWNSLLSKLLSFHMIPYLTHVLPPLSGVTQLREIPLLTKVWKGVITAPFLSVSIPLSAEEEKSCLRSAQLLTRCPVILDLDLVEIASLMKKVGLYMQALFCLKMCPNKKLRKESIMALLDDVGVDIILSKVKKDRDQGIMDPHLDAVEHEAFDYVEEHGLYLKLFGTDFFNPLIEYLIYSGKVNKLLVKTIMAGKLDYAIGLFSKFIVVHPEHEIVRTIADEGLDASSALLMYLESEGLQKDIQPYLTSSQRANTLRDNSVSFDNSKVFI